MFSDLLCLGKEVVEVRARERCGEREYVIGGFGEGCFYRKFCNILINIFIRVRR